ncbi:MAG: hypothetical protein ACI3Y7_00750 [Candidatus Cryptobacteroides sp.]
MLGRYAITMLVCTLLTGSIRATSGISEERSAVDTTHREQISLQILFSRSSSEIELGFADNSINIESFFAALRRSLPARAAASPSSTATPTATPAFPSAPYTANRFLDSLRSK